MRPQRFGEEEEEVEEERRGAEDAEWPHKKGREGTEDDEEEGERREGSWRAPASYYPLFGFLDV